MNRIRRWQTIQRAALLFVLALGGWLAFQYVARGSFALIPGLLTALILATAGSSVLRYLDEPLAGRPVIAPLQRAVGSRPSAAHRRAPTAPAPSPTRHWHRPAA